MDEPPPPQDAGPGMDGYDKAPGGGENGSTSGAASSAPGAAGGGGVDADMGTGDEGQVHPPGNPMFVPLGAGGGSGVPGHGSGGGGNLYMRPIFLGNLSHGCMAADVENIFQNPGAGGMNDGEVRSPFPVDRVDMKRGYCFVFLKDAETLAEKERTENYVQEINGMHFSQVSNALRAEFARGDGRVKRKEDERRKKIIPNETLFVVNFHEETTKREDLQMLFEPYGELVRIDMKRNYAFVQFKTVDEAARAREATNGGKLDQSEITVEFVARRMGDPGRGPPGRDDYRGGGRRYDDRGDWDRGGYRGGGGHRGRDEYRPRRDEHRPRGGGYRDKYDDDYRRGGRDDRRRRSRSRSRSPEYRRRSRSRSPGYGRDHRSSRDEYRPSSRGGRDSYEDRERVERGYGRSEY